MSIVLATYKLDLQREHRVSSVEHNSGIVRYRRNYGIDPASAKIARRRIRTQSDVVDTQLIRVMPTNTQSRHVPTLRACRRLPFIYLFYLLYYGGALASM